MSHVVDIQTTINDLDALEAAAESLGLELVRGQRKFRWYGRHVGDYPLPPGFSVDDMGKCEHAIRVKDGTGHEYEIGVVKRRHGEGWTLLYDHYAGGKGMSNVAGDRCQHLLQNYAVEKVKRTVRRTHRVHHHRLPNGAVKLTLTRS